MDINIFSRSSKCNKYEEPIKVGPKRLPNSVVLLLVFIFFQPLVNSANGYILNHGGSSLIGPIFYITSFILFFVYALIKKYYMLFAMTIAWWLIFSYHNFAGLSSPSDLANYLKIFYPIAIYAAVREMPLSRNRLTRIGSAVNFSIYLYCALIVLSFFLGYKSRHGSGYFGFVDGNNDLTVLLLLWLSFTFWLEQKGLRARKEFVFLSFLLTFSKSILFMIPSMIMSYLNRFKLSYLAFAGIFLYMALFVQNLIFQRSFIAYYEPIFSDGKWLTALHDEMFWRLITFGRSDLLITAYEKGAFAWPNFILGNGFKGMNFYLPGKIGIEMDLFDSIAQYGLPGIMWLIGFYYIPLIISTIDTRAKIAFIFVILYSITGGHFYNNPLVGFYYGLYLGLVSNRSIRGYCTESRVPS